MCTKKRKKVHMKYIVCSYIPSKAFEWLQIENKVIKEKENERNAVEFVEKISEKLKVSTEEGLSYDLFECRRIDWKYATIRTCEL